MNELEQMDLVGVADAIARGELSARDAVQWSIGRLEQTGRSLNAVFRIDADAAMNRARALDELQSRRGVCGPLHGVPLAHKDLFQVVGREYHAGSKILRGTIATQDSFALAQLDRAGQVNVGSLHMAEFALSPTGFNGHYGPSLNPWSHAHVSGGSSSGSAVAVAARLVFGSLGSDTAGSIRVPAAVCGVTGLKTTFRRISAFGSFPLSTSLDSIGPLAQSARDCARILTHVARPNPDDALSAAVNAPDYEQALDGNVVGLNIGVPDAYFGAGLDDEMSTCLRASLEVLRGRGANVVRVPVPDMDLVNALAHVVLSVEAATLHRKWLASRPDDYSPQVRARIEQGFAYSGVRYAEALSLRRKVASAFVASVFGACDVLHVPVLAGGTPTILETTQGEQSAVLAAIARTTYATRGINYLGLPAMSVPAGFSAKKLPIGFQLIGRPFSEALLLKVADTYQQETPWHRRLPPLASEASFKAAA